MTTKSEPSPVAFVGTVSAAPVARVGFVGTAPLRAPEKPAQTLTDEEMVSEFKRMMEANEDESVPYHMANMMGSVPAELAAKYFKAGVELMVERDSLHHAEAVLYAIGRHTHAMDSRNDETKNSYYEAVSDAVGFIADGMLTPSSPLAAKNWLPTSTSAGSYPPIFCLTNSIFFLDKLNTERLIPALIKLGAQELSYLHNRWVDDVLLTALYRIDEDPATLQAILAAKPSFAAALREPWFVEKSVNLPALTKEIAETALSRLEPDSPVRDAILSKCSLSWLAANEVSRQIAQGPNGLRFEEFTDASATQFSEMIEQYLLGHESNPVREDHTKLANFKKYVTDTEAMRPVFAGIWLKRINDVGPLYSINALRDIADAQITPEAGRSLLHEYLQAGFDQIKADAKTLDPEKRKQVQADDVELLLLAAVGCSGPVWGSGAQYSVCADVEFVVSLIRQIDATNIFSDNTEESKKVFALNLRNKLEHAAVTQADRVTIQSALIESGALTMNNLLRRDLTAAMVGPTLRTQPHRLSEFQRLDDFIKFGKIFNIPMDLPPGAEAEAAASAVASKMSKVISDAKIQIAAVDPLASIDPLAALDSTPRRRGARLG